MVKTIAEINSYVSAAVNPLKSPEQMYELYSVPSYDKGYPEIIKGRLIGSAKVAVQENDVLVCKINPRINRVWVVKHNTEYPLIASSEWIVVRSPENDSEYLKWYFQSPRFQKLMVSQVTGIGGSLTRAQPKQVSTYSVPIPTISTQHYIADVLDKVSEGITICTQMLSNFDLLIKARFVEMFGDPVDNDHEWPTQSLESACTTIVDCPHSTPSYTVAYTGYMCIRTSIVKKNRILWDEIEYIPEQEYYQRIQRKRPEKGDIIYTREGAILGIAAMIDRECNVALGQRSMLLSPETTCQVLFSIL